MAEIKTCHRLLDHAEKLFAQKGFDGVPIREIAAAAEVNVAAINYHFQSKENLYVQVLERRILPKRDRLIAMLDELKEHEADGSRLETLLRAFVTTHLDDALRGPGGAMAMRLLSRELSEPGHGAQVVLDGLIRPVRERMRAMLGELLPELGDREVLLFMGSVMGQILYFAMNWHGKLPAAQGDDYEHPIPKIAPDLETYIETVIDHVTHFALAGAETMRKEAGA